MKKSVKFILVIDDDTTTTLMIEKMIMDTGKVAEVAVAKSGSEALNLLHRRSEMGYSLPDITFLDLNMPHMSGWDFLGKYIDTFKKEINRQVILLTSSNCTKDLIKSAVHPDVDDFINKPIMKVEIEQVIDQHLVKYAYAS